MARGEPRFNQMKQNTERMQVRLRGDNGDDDDDDDDDDNNRHYCFIAWL
jgi:hypothetical protein